MPTYRLPDPQLRRAFAAICESRFYHEPRVWAALSRAGMPFWTGERPGMTVEDVAREVTSEPALSDEEQREVLWLLGS